ncbi:ABC-2 family transporter protein [Candidatus Daviesbacteria bacterium]|nr:ABC-2 family transporter protein [Candidatus Daviesbacteria bacterium]
MLKKYLKIWWIYAINSFQSQFAVRWALLVFLIGKILRFSLFTLFIIILLQKTNVLAGYTLNQTMLFFLSFNLVDILTQLVFREVYRFRSQIVFGNFDFSLSKPINPLFKSLFGGPDILDFFTLIPLIFAIFYFISQMGMMDLFSIMLYLLLIIVAFVISLSFHILVLSLAILTTEIDHTIMLYRDIAAMGRMPIDIYKEPIRGLLTFVIPVGIMMSYPTKALLGVLSPVFIIYAFIFAVSFLLLSLKVWNYALKKYSSASS